MSAPTSRPEYAYVNGECGPEENQMGLPRHSPRGDGGRALGSPRLPAYINGEIGPEELAEMRRGR